MSEVKEFSTYTLESPLIKFGEFTNSKGEKLKVTPEVAIDIYKQLESAKPLKDIHIDGEMIGSIQKFVLNSDGIYQKSAITNTALFESRYNDGNFYISPEIETEDDGNGNLVSARLLGAALTNRPGMITDMPKVTRHYFEAQQPTGEQPPIANDAWQEPIGEIKQQLNELKSTITSMTKEESSNPTDNSISMGVDDLAKLIDDAVEKRIASMQQQKTPEASETTDEAKKSEVDESDETAKEYAKMKSELESIKNSQEKAYKKQLSSLVSEMKALGIKNPDKLVPDNFSTEQKIIALETFKESFAKESEISTPLQETLAGSPDIKKPGVITIDDVLDNFDEIFGTSGDDAGKIRDDPSMRHKLQKLSDPDLMRKYNMNVLFDSNGIYIGPN